MKNGKTYVQYRLNFPKKLVEEFNLTENDEIVMVQNGNSIMLQKKQ